MEAFLGSWKLSTSEGFDEIMQKLGIGFLTRKAGNSQKPTVIFASLGDGRYSMRTESTFKNTDATFKLGEEFDEATSDGRTVKSTITVDGGTMKHVQVGDKTTYVERTVSGSNLNVIVKVDDLQATRVYTKR